MYGTELVTLTLSPYPGLVACSVWDDCIVWFCLFCRKIHKLPAEFSTAHGLTRQTSVNAPRFQRQWTPYSTLLLSTLAGLWAWLDLPFGYDAPLLECATPCRNCTDFCSSSSPCSESCRRRSSLR